MYFKHRRVYATRRYPGIPSDFGTKRSEAVDENNRDHKKYENKGPPWYAERKRISCPCVSCQNVGVVSNNFLGLARPQERSRTHEYSELSHTLPRPRYLSRKLYKSSPSHRARPFVGNEILISVLPHSAPGFTETVALLARAVTGPKTFGRHLYTCVRAPLFRFLLLDKS